MTRNRWKCHSGKAVWTSDPFTEKNEKKIKMANKSRWRSLTPLFCKSVCTAITNRLNRTGFGAQAYLYMIRPLHHVFMKFYRNSKWPTFQDGGFSYIRNLKTVSEYSYVTKMILFRSERFLRRLCIWHCSITTWLLKIQDSRLSCSYFMIWCVQPLWIKLDGPDLVHWCVILGWVYCIILHRWLMKSTKNASKFDESVAVMFLSKWENTKLNFK